MAAGRRRTDPPDGLWRGASADELSDQPTDPGRARTERAVGGTRAPESPRLRPRLPLPPVPAPAAAAGPRTTAAPFRAVPAPDRAPVMAGSAPAPAQQLPPSRPWTADDAPLAVPGPRVPASPPAAGYGDWTKPSRPVDEDHLSGPIGARVPAAPATTAIPDRPVSGRRGRSADAYDDGYANEYDDSYGDEPLEAPTAAPAASRVPATGPVVGGRAARRVERQAAEQARQRAAKRNGVSTPSAAAVLDEDGRPDRKPRRVAKGLVAMVVVALGVLGAYSFVSPKTSVAASQMPAASGSASAAASETAALPPLATTAVAPPAVAAAPVRVPVTVLNATAINGLAAKVAGALTPKGWPAGGVGAYKAGDVAASTVFFTQGDEKQRQAAVQLVDQFPKLTGPAVRFFQLPAGVTAPGLVVVLTGDWQP